MQRKNAPEDINIWWNNLSEKMKWQVFDSAWCWSLLRKGETIKDSMEKVGYSKSAINSVLTKVDISLRNAERKKDTKPTFWMSKYNNDYKSLDSKIKNFWDDDYSYKNFPGLCCYIGCSKVTYLDSISNERVPEGIINILKREKMQIEAYQLDKIHESPAGGIFNLKNNHGYIDHKQVTVGPSYEVVSIDDNLMNDSKKILYRCELELKPEDIE